VSEFEYQCVIAISCSLYTYFFGSRPLYHFCIKKHVVAEAQIILFYFIGQIIGLHKSIPLRRIFIPEKP
jgi:hypothetical protein